MGERDHAERISPVESEPINESPKIVSLNSAARTPEHYFETLPDDRKEPMRELRKIILKNLPSGFSEEMSYGMVGYVVPHSLYPKGYHCNPKLPLPFISLASQKNFIALYHMGIYGIKDMLEWFTLQYPKHSSYKLDMGKGCIRFKKPEQIPYELIAQLVKKISVEDWIKVYEMEIKK
jgi:uncharacterized protein YdhG (YjbR/CyaY superfamily)